MVHCKRQEFAYHSGSLADNDRDQIKITGVKTMQVGGTLNAEWKLATVTVPVSKIELVVNGETRDVVSSLHNRTHNAGIFHDHSPMDKHNHPDHRQ